LKKISSICLGLVTLLFSACSGEVTPTETSTATVSPVPTLDRTIAPDIIPTVPSAVGTPTFVPINNLTDASYGVVRIVVPETPQYPPMGEYVPVGGSGVLLDWRGLVVTNAHVVGGESQVDVYLNWEKEPRKATVLGVSECYDLAVLDIDGEGYPYMTWFTSRADPGLKVYSLGYALGDTNLTSHAGLTYSSSSTLQTGIVDADGVVEHDANIDPGMSGGALVSEGGYLVGVNYAQNRNYDRFYALPERIAYPVIQNLAAGKNVDSIGINGAAIKPENNQFSGVWVISVRPGSPADQAEIKPGDVIIELGGNRLAEDGTLASYCKILRNHQGTDPISVKTIRLSSMALMEGQIYAQALQPSGLIETNPFQQTGGSEYFTETFDQPLTGWSQFILKGDRTGPSPTQKNGRMSFDIRGYNTSMFLIYDLAEYTDVKVSAQVENRAVFMNQMTLVCRYSKEQGWYEFNVSSDGTYTIYRYDALRKEYRYLWKAASTAIRMGKDVNIISATCVSDEMTLFINDVKIQSVQDRSLRSGKIGISASSLGYIPVVVEFDSVSVSKP